ncbi:MAG TPA: hypothetical protein VKE74_12005 [Gemmataceae bacterium]|nr:hypothetical protein [Gemmataceae bacterium]
MPRLTLRTLLAYIDDTLAPSQARALGAKVAESESARELIERIKRVTRRRGLKTPVPAGGEDDVADPNTVAEYLSDTLESDQVAKLEETCLKSDVHLAEVAAVHQILTLVLTEPVRVPPRANQRMYKLVEPPASQPNRRPGKARPIAAIALAPTKPDSDDADATLLLGMKRYSAASKASRLGLAAAALACAVLLVAAVLMTVWHGNTSEPPPTGRGPVTAVVTSPPTPGSGPPPGPDETLPEAPMPREKGEEPGPMAVAPPPMDNLGDKVPPPRDDRVPIGKVETPNVLVFTRPMDGPRWVRVDAAQPVNSQNELICLPGYKADVRLESGVGLHLWGNVPEQLGSTAAGVRVPLEARVRIHQPPQGFDADLTLLTGRVYLSTKNPEGAKVLVRFAGEVWNIRLKDEKTDVMVEVLTAFVPGSPYFREGGEPARVSARIAVSKGAADLDAPKRFKKLAEVAGPAVLTWNSVTGQVDGPKPYDRADPNFVRFLDTYIPPEWAKMVNQSLADFVGRLVDPNGLHLMLAEQLGQPPSTDRVRQLECRLAVYAQAAIATTPEIEDGIALLVDVLNEQIRGYARAVAPTALSAWLARDPANTARLFTVMVEKKRVPADEADLILQLLRGYVPVRRSTPKDYEKVDQLVKHLSSRSIAVRELALWNLLTFVDPSAATHGLATDVALDAPEYGYDKFVNAWKQRIEDLKKRPETEKKDEKKEPEVKKP